MKYDSITDHASMDDDMWHFSANPNLTEVQESRENATFWVAWDLLLWFRWLNRPYQQNHQLCSKKFWFLDIQPFFFLFSSKALKLWIKYIGWAWNLFYLKQLTGFKVRREQFWLMLQTVWGFCFYKKNYRKI